MGLFEIKLAFNSFMAAERKLREETAVFKSKAEQGDSELQGMQDTLMKTRAELERVEVELRRAIQSGRLVADLRLRRDAQREVVDRLVKAIIRHRKGGEKAYLDEAAQSPVVKEAAEAYRDAMRLFKEASRGIDAAAAERDSTGGEADGEDDAGWLDRARRAAIRLEGISVDGDGEGAAAPYAHLPPLRAVRRADGMNLLVKDPIWNRR